MARDLIRGFNTVELTVSRHRSVTVAGTVPRTRTEMVASYPFDRGDEIRVAAWAMARPDSMGHETISVSDAGYGSHDRC